MENETTQPAPGPAETLSEKLQDRNWLIGVRKDQEELVVEMRRWSAVILIEIPETWEGIPVRILRQSQRKPDHDPTVEQVKGGEAK